MIGQTSLRMPGRHVESQWLKLFLKARYTPFDWNLQWFAFYDAWWLTIVKAMIKGGVNLMNESSVVVSILNSIGLANAVLQHCQLSVDVWSICQQTGG